MDSGRIVETIGYAHSDAVKMPDGYERYQYPVAYKGSIAAACFDGCKQRAQDLAFICNATGHNEF